jgi:hypothetical protein
MAMLAELLQDFAEAALLGRYGGHAHSFWAVKEAGIVSNSLRRLSKVRYGEFPRRGNEGVNQMRPIICQCLAALLFVLTPIVAITPAARADVTAEEVRESIRRAVDYLKSQQDKVRGSWPDYSLGTPQPGGVTALCTLALLNAGVEVKDPAIQKSLAFLRRLEAPDTVYVASLQTMVFCAAEPEKDRLLISRNVKLLEGMQIKRSPLGADPKGDTKGCWSYKATDVPGAGDNSNAQFALLALHEAELVGVKVEEQTWRLALSYWLRCQREEGAWPYMAGMPARGSMTCAGITSVIIATDRLNAGDARVVGGHVHCCGEQEENAALEKAFDWLGRMLKPGRAAPAGARGGSQTDLYFLYGLERVGRLSGRRFIGGKDWYREGAEYLVGAQDDLTGYFKGTGHAEGDPNIGTALALLFLSKGRRPVVIAKLKHGTTQDWDLHRSAVHNLTRYVEKRWKRDLTWQTVEGRAATVDDLLQGAVLYISGREELSFTAEQKENLKQYINQGGFIFAEDCCDGAGFDRDFRALMKEIFPDNELRLLPPDHPVWYAEQKVSPEYMRPLYGIDACCRTSVVYCPKNLACYWELHEGERESKYPKAVQDEIAACLAIGANVLAYATNREVPEKLRPKVSVSDGLNEQLTRGALFIPKLAHGGGSDDAPSALSNLLKTAEKQLDARLNPKKIVVTPTDPKLFEYPIVFMHGRRAFRWSNAERKALAMYFERGGFLFADSICANPQFAESLREELKAILPEGKLARIPAEHPMFTPEFRGYDLSTVTLRDPKLRSEGDKLESKLQKTAPLFEGLEINGRMAVVFSPYDLSCALENHESLECKGYVKTDAAKLGVNVILYALQQ